MGNFREENLVGNFWSKCKETATFLTPWFTGLEFCRQSAGIGRGQQKHGEAVAEITANT